MKLDRVTASTSSVEAEQGMLGAILNNNDLFHEVSAILRPDFFSEPLHGAIWSNMSARIERDHMASVVSLAADFADNETLMALGGNGYLSRMAAFACPAFAVRDYALLIVELHQRRVLAGRFSQMAEELLHGRASDEVAAEAEILLMERSEQSPEPRTMSFLKAQTKALETMTEIKKGVQVGVTSGLRTLDDKISLAPKRYTILGGQTSMGKAQPLTSNVLCLDGWKRMGEIQIGDELSSVDGAPSRVIGVFPQGEKAIYKITFSDGRVVRCCGDHLWQTHGPGRDQSRVMTTDQISDALSKRSYQGRLKVPLFEGEFGCVSALPVDPWLLGVLIGDGALTKGACFSTPDAEILMRIQQTVGWDSVKSRGGYDYSITTPKGKSNPVLDALKGLGLLGRRSEERFIPDQYLTANKAARLELLRGLMDTDGWVETFGAVRFSTSSKSLADQVRALVWSLGGVCSISMKRPKFTHKGEAKVGQDHHVLNIRHKDAGEFFTLIKKKRRCNRVKPVRLTIKSVEADGYEEAQCIAVSHPSHLYITDGFVVTHNTALALHIAYSAAKAGDGVGFVTLEMPEEDLSNRVNSIESLQPYNTYDRPMSDQSFSGVVEAAKRLQGLPIEIFSERVRDVSSILSEGKKLKRKMQPRGQFKGFKLLVIDYIQLVRGRGENALVKLSQVANDLKQVAKQLDVHVLALAQVDRQLGKLDKWDQWPQARPGLAHLRGSGDLENAPDNVMFVFRPQYYLTPPRCTPPKDPAERADWEAEYNHWKGKAEIIISKARMGEIGSIEVGCDLSTNRFWDLDDGQERMF